MRPRSMLLGCPTLLGFDNGDEGVSGISLLQTTCTILYHSSACHSSIVACHEYRPKNQRLPSPSLADVLST